VFEHKQKLVPGFTQKHGLSKLVYFEATEGVLSAIAREKEIKGWLRKKKLALIAMANPGWKDLSEGWYG
jgi:putative endonuclease